MSESIKIEVRAAEGAGADAPAAREALAQIQDVVAVLEAADAALAPRGAARTAWRITNASMRSPLMCEVAPCAEEAAGRLPAVARLSAALLSGKADAQSPAPTAKVRQAVRNIHSRVACGLAETAVDFSACPGVRPVRIRPKAARKFLERMEEARASDAFAEPVQGSIEGFVRRVGMDDASGRPALWMRSRLDGKMIKCIAAERGLDALRDLPVGKVVGNLRVRVYGRVKYKSLGHAESAEIERIHVFRDSHDLPGSKDILCPGFTKGVESVEYVRRMRNMREDG